MPKMKTRKGIAKRFKVTKRRKVLRHKGGKGHLLGHKTKKRKRALRRAALVSKHERKKILKLLPYA
ncbi:MAG: 50S ribosomal protein L35 [Candidatus Omnitrophica bacterium]|nr:50S ribosomal protein L35 [Candidatus Omnitrophota bacterium]